MSFRLPSLNIDFTMQELELGLSKLKSQAVWLNRIHSEILTNLNTSNRALLLHLLNSISYMVPVLHNGKTRLLLLKWNKYEKTSIDMVQRNNCLLSILLPFCSRFFMLIFCSVVLVIHLWLSYTTSYRQHSKIIELIGIYYRTVIAYLIKV